MSTGNTTNKQTASDPAVGSSDLLGWLRGKLAEAEKALRCREEMQTTWAGGTSESWRRVGCRLTKTERLKTSELHGRIAVKCRQEVEMFKEAIATLTQPNSGVDRM